MTRPRPRRHVAKKSVTNRNYHNGVFLRAEYLPYPSVDEALEVPFLHIGTVDEMAQQFWERRERYVLSCFVVHQPYTETLAPVIERVRGRSHPRTR